MITTKAVMDSLLNPAAGVESLAVLSRFRLDFHACRAARADELADAVLCADGPVRTLAGLPLPRAADGRLVLAVDMSNWLRPGAATSPERLFCHVYGRGKGQAQMIPGWPLLAMFRSLGYTARSCRCKSEVIGM